MKIRICYAFGPGNSRLSRVCSQSGCFPSKLPDWTRLGSAPANGRLKMQPLGLHGGRSHNAASLPPFKTMSKARGVENQGSSLLMQLRLEDNRTDRHDRCPMRDDEHTGRRSLGDCSSLRADVFTHTVCLQFWWYQRTLKPAIELASRHNLSVESAGPQMMCPGSLVLNYKGRCWT